MDNFRVDITSDNDLEACLQLAFGGFSAWSWATTSLESDGTESLVLYWSNTERSHPFPIPLTAALATPFVQEWLDKADRGSKPGIDGDCSADGFRILNHRESGWSYELVTIEPVWAHHHK